MKFFVVNHDYKPISDPHDTLADAGRYALDAVLNAEVPTALVVAMDSGEFREDVAAGICLIVGEGFDLDAHR